MRTRSGDADVFFRELFQGSGGGWPEMGAGEAWGEADDFFSAFGGAARAHARRLQGRPAEDAEAGPGPIDAVVKLPSGKAYFFYGSDYVRYDVATDRADAGYPKPIAGNWPGLFTSNIGAGIEWSADKVYFFKGSQYSRYDIPSDRVDPGFPKPIAGNWPGLFTSGIDAAVNWGDGKAYFFKGGEYTRYDIAADRADPGYPKPIAGNWPGLFTSDIDDAVNWGNGKVYFFKGDEYIRYDIAADRVDAGFPARIPGNWSGLHPASTCTCTDSGRKYSKGLVDTANLIGTKACIKTRYGKLCCEGTTSTVPAASVAWTGVTKPAAPKMWAQIGYGRERLTGDTSAANFRYWEIADPAWNIFNDYPNAPANNSQHTYRCEVDTATGQWTFEDNGVVWSPPPPLTPGWAGVTGTRADYVGEIVNETDDMPGTASNKCTFRECKKKSTGGSYVAAGLTTANVDSSNAAEWGATRISSTGMDIWDKHPLP